MELNKLYEQKCNEVSDIYYHLPKLKELSSKSNHVTEFGVRGGNSTIALLAGQPQKLISYDINPCPKFLWDIEENTDFRFFQKNVLNIEIDPTDFLFIDTLHTYEQLSQELKLHGSKVSKWIAFHDTKLFGMRGENYEGKEVDGLWKAIGEFLCENPNWYPCYITEENNGLAVIERFY